MIGGRISESRLSRLWEVNMHAFSVPACNIFAFGATAVHGAGMQPDLGLKWLLHDAAQEKLRRKKFLGNSSFSLGIWLLVKRP
jgi:hypothetical protein